MEKCSDCGLELAEPESVRVCPRCGCEYSIQADGQMMFHLVCGRNIMSCECVDEEGARP